jgi:hypothetical protein
MRRSLIALILFLLFQPLLSFAESPTTSVPVSACIATDLKCIVARISALAEKIETDNWRDQTYRELSKTMAANGMAIQAIPYISKIKNPDTQALTIRGIGMEAAMADVIPDGLFSMLRQEADRITDPPSHGIALTYIAMAQAYAGDDAGAEKTASEMENEALSHKAFAETAEIQAEKGKFDIAIKSISLIDSASFKNKAYKNVSRIFSETGRYQEAYDTAQFISNPVMQAEALQFMLDTQRIEKEKGLAKQ